MTFGFGARSRYERGGALCRIESRRNRFGGGGRAGFSGGNLRCARLRDQGGFPG
jgi:hypothetical protein